jgi:uncharacterized protein DUF4340
MKAFAKTFLALILFAGLFSYWFFVDRHKKGTAETENAKEKVFTVEKEKVKELGVAKSEGDPVRLVKEGSDWKLTSPSAAPADGAQVDSLLSTIQTAEINRVVTEQPESLATFGLDKPRLKVSVLADGEKEAQTLELGNKTPDENNLYAKMPTKARVFTVPYHLETTFDKKPFDLRDRSVLHVKRDAIKTLEVTGPEGTMALARKDKDNWVFTSPVKTLAGRWSVDGLLGNLENLQMDAIAAEDAKDLKAYGLDKPTRVVVLGLQDGGAKRLEIGGKVPSAEKFYAREAARNMVAEIPQALPTDLAKGIGELRAKRLLDVAAYEVTGIDLTVDGQKRTLERSSTKEGELVDDYKWKKTAPEKKDLETNTVQDVLFQIGGVSVTEFIDKPGALGAYGLDAPALKVTLSQKDKPAVWFEVAKKDGAVYARRDGDEAILKLDAKGNDLIEAFKKL